MKFFLFILLPLVWADEPPTGSALVAEWNGCLDRLESFEARRRTRVPDSIWDVDPELRARRRAIANQRVVLDWTRVRLEAGGGAPERHLTENGVQGCERFRSAYEARAEAFLHLLAVLGCLILVLTARVAVAMVPATSPGATDVQDDSSSPPRSSGVS